MAVRANKREGLKAGSWFQSARQRRRHIRRTFRIAADLKLVTSVRKVPPSDDGGFPPELVPAGTRSVSAFLVNDGRPKPEESRDEVYIFQAHLILSTPLVPRPNLRGLVVSIDDTDEQIADLQYRDCFEYAVGHGVATSVGVSPTRRN